MSSGLKFNLDPLNGGEEGMVWNVFSVFFFSQISLTQLLLKCVALESINSKENLSQIRKYILLSCVRLLNSCQGN